MPPRRRIPDEVLILNPEVNIHEARSLINIILKSYSNRVRQSHIFKVKLPGLGILRSRGNKRPKRRQKVLKNDRIRKRMKKLSKN